MTWSNGIGKSFSRRHSFHMHHLACIAREGREKDMDSLIRTSFWGNKGWSKYIFNIHEVFQRLFVKKITTHKTKCSNYVLMVRQKEKRLVHHIDDMGSPQLSNPSSNKHNGGIFIHTQIFGKLSNESWVMNQSKQANGCNGFSLHCKDIQSNLYSFQMCPNFHCNLTVQFTFNCYSKYNQITVKLI